MPRVLLYHASRDLVPLYAVYSLLFADHGISASHISLLLIIWSATSFVFEVPSGAWADTFDRRRLLVVSAVVYAAGFATWMIWQTFPGFALGFVLWGLSSSLMSGTFESLVYDELVSAAPSDAYPSLIGWAHSTALVANLAATLLAAPLLALGGYALVGWASVAICGGQARPRGDAARLRAGPTPRPRLAARRDRARRVALRRDAPRRSRRVAAPSRRASDPAAGGGHGRPDGLRRVLPARGPGPRGLHRRHPAAGRDHGRRAGGRHGPGRPHRAPRRARRGRSARPSGALLVSVGALVTPYVGFVAIGVGYGVLNNAMLVGETRLQDTITGPARATVTSVLGFLEEIVRPRGVRRVRARLARARLPGPRGAAGGPGPRGGSRPWLGACRRPGGSARILRSARRRPNLSRHAVAARAARRAGGSSRWTSRSPTWPWPTSAGPRSPSPSTRCPA